MIGETEVVLKGSHGLSNAVFGASLAASAAEEGNVGNQVEALRTIIAPGSFHLDVGGFQAWFMLACFVSISVCDISPQLL